MYHPQEKQYRFMTVHLCERHKDRLEAITTSWEEYKDDFGNTLAILPTYNIIWK